MPRTLWSGSLSFGLVNVPVALVSAARDLDLHFRQLHEKDGTPIEVKRFCSKEDREVDAADVARSYEFEDGAEVVVSDEELEALEPRRTRTVEVEQFVDLADVDPVLFDHPYLVVPAGDNEGALRAYRLLVEVMAATERAALGRVVMRTKEYLTIVRAREGVLTLQTMRFHDEVRSAKDVDGASGARPRREVLRETVALIEAMTVDWDPGRYEDRHRERLREIVERKRKGRKVRAPEAIEEPDPVPDLMAALRASLDAARGGGGGGGARRRGGDGADDLDGLTREQLYERAQAQGIPGRSSMTKEQLAKALSA
jgi:DNA end-binding protein Ku